MAHIHEKIDVTVSAYIVFDHTVLLHVHKTLNIWLPPGGHIELDEDPNQAAVREAKEETGLDIELIGTSRVYDSPYDSRDLIPPRFLNRHYYDLSRTHEHVDFAFFARPTSFETRPEEAGGELRWFSLEELSDPQYEVVADVQAHAALALREIGVH